MTSSGLVMELLNIYLSSSGHHHSRGECLWVCECVCIMFVRGGGGGGGVNRNSGMYVGPCKIVMPYRRVSHGLGWPANAVLFLPSGKGKRKLRNAPAPAASSCAPNKLNMISGLLHLTCFARFRCCVRPAG